MLRKRIRDLAVGLLMLLPLRIRVWLLDRWLHPLLWFMFRLESEVVTVAPVGPDFCRFRMSYAWQDAPHYVLGAYEPEVAEVLRSEITPGSVCFDVGANVGYYAILMARLAGNRGVVVAFEPVPLNFETLQRNIALNTLENVRLEPLAVSAQEATLRLNVDLHDAFPKTASTSGYAVGKDRKVIDVASTALDAYLERTGETPDLILIDVEGAELEVLRGAQNTLRKVQPKLLIEIHGWNGPEHDAVGEYLAQFGYQRKIIGHRNREAFGFFQPVAAPVASCVGAPE